MAQRDKPPGRVARARRRKAAAAKRGTAQKTRAGSRPSSAALQKQLELRTRDLREALDQQAATADVLKVISQATFDLQTVLDTLVESVARLCEADMAAINRQKGNFYYAATHYGLPPELKTSMAERPLSPGRGSISGRALLERKVVHVHDVHADPEYTMTDVVHFGRLRTMLGVPLLREGQPIGTITLMRNQVRPFTDREIGLVTIFAAQAVIAIENTRLLNELRQRTDDLTESLEQQTATSDVLGVISSSPGALQPVFDTILENATRICNAKFGNLLLFKDGVFRRMALYGAPHAWEDDRDRAPEFRPGPLNPIGRMIETKAVVHVPDMAAEPGYRAGDPAVVGVVENAKARTIMAVPMLKEGELVGAIAIYRQEVKPFSDKQVALVQNFTAQAVIAIENTRLLNELRQSLQQQTATADVLKIISRSAFDLQAVLDTLVESAARLCRADRTTIRLLRGGRYHHVASHGYSTEHRRQMEQEPITLDQGSVVTFTVKTGAPVHIADGQAHPDPDLARRARSGNVHTMLSIAMSRAGASIGVLLLTRSIIQPFTASEIELATTFADQAVIAIENVRLFDEVQARTRELSVSLQQQTATADVLKVISRSTFDLQTVLDTLVESAARLCEAELANIARPDAEGFFRIAASHGSSPAGRNAQAKLRIRPGRESLFGRVLLEGHPVQIADVATDPEYALTEARKANELHTLLGVPLMREGTPIGVFGVGRATVRPFTDKQIELLTTFADQAVIAIENVRLFDEVQTRTRELSESLQQQTATAEVLKIISRSTFDLQTVLNTLVESAARLCEADMASINREHGPAYRQVASFGQPPELQAYMDRNPIPAGGGSVVGRTVAQGKMIHVHDVMADPNFKLKDAAGIGGIRTMLGIPLLREGTPIGVIVLQRRVMRPFTEKQIELATTFADQAVIAIENVRLFDDIQDKSRLLAEASAHKSQFLANMSHELRTPLNAILGYTELVADGIYGVPPEKMRTVLGRIENNGRHLLGLINAVLDLSKIEAGQFVLDIGNYSLAGVIETAFNAVESLAVEKNLVLRVEASSDLPPGRGDERRLTQVLLNLIGNAIKFTDQGEVVISATVEGDAFNLAVRDTGPGLSDADQARLFQQFQQADNSITRKKGGTGLGLAISKRIIEMHGGRIWVNSVVGQGSTFAFTLPVRVEQQVKVD